MHKESILNQLYILETRLDKLLAEHTGLKRELADCKKENSALKSAVEKQKEDLLFFQNQDKISKIVSSIAEDTHKSTELKLKINEYIKEIDKCIAYLSDS